MRKFYAAIMGMACWLACPDFASAQNLTPRDASAALSGVRPSDIIYQKIDTSRTVAPVQTIGAVQGGARRNLSELFNRLTLGIFASRPQTGSSQFPTQQFPQQNSMFQPQRPIIPSATPQR